MVMNFVIATAMLMTPMIVKSIVGSGLQGMSTTLGASSIAAMAAVPAKALQIQQASRGALNSGKSYLNNRFENKKPIQNFKRSK